MAAESVPSGRVLSRALARPIHAMSRMLGGVGGTPAPVDPTATRGSSAVIDCALYIDGARQPGQWNYAQALAAARREGGFVWLGLKEPDITELSRIGQTFGLHELSVEDAVNAGQRPKIERYPDMTFVALRTARYVEHAELTESSEVVETGAMMMFINEHFIITVRHGDACQLRSVRLDLEEQRRDLLRQGPWAVAYAVYDMVVDVLLDVSSEIEEDVAAIEDSVFSSHATHRIQRIYQLKRELMEFKRAVLPLQRPLGGLADGQLCDIPAEVRRYLRDVNDHLTRTVEQVVYFDDVLNSLLQARLAQVSVDQNNDMRKIAAWAGIAAVWTAIAGVYGMNFRFMPEIDWRYGYPVVLAVMVSVSIALYRGFRRNGWL